MQAIQARVGACKDRGGPAPMQPRRAVPNGAQAAAARKRGLPDTAPARPRQPPARIRTQRGSRRTETGSSLRPATSWGTVS